MNAEERYRNEAHVLTRERDEALAEAERLRAALEAFADRYAELGFTPSGYPTDLFKDARAALAKEPYDPKNYNTLTGKRLAKGPTDAEILRGLGYTSGEEA